MNRVIGDSSTGKTRKLMLLAKENSGAFVCECPERMREKALAYEIIGVNIIGYEEAVRLRNTPMKLYIDDLEKFLRLYLPWVDGYTLTIE